MECKLFSSGKPISFTIAIQNEEFVLAGEVMVLSILQGGPAPSFLHPSLFKFIANLPLCAELDCEPSQYQRAALKVSEKLVQIYMELHILQFLLNSDRSLYLVMCAVMC